MNLKNRLILTIAALVVLTNGQLAISQNANEILERVQKKYDSYSAICAQFKQTFHWELADETQIVEGQLCVKNGKKFRIETKDQEIVSDGETIWTINNINQQVIINTAENNENDNPFLKNFIRKYIDNYTASIVAKEGEIVTLILKSRSDNEFYPTINLWINQKQSFLSKIQQIDINENSTTYEILSLDEKAEIEESSFKYKKVEGFELIDLR